MIILQLVVIDRPLSILTHFAHGRQLMGLGASSPFAKM